MSRTAFRGFRGTIAELEAAKPMAGNGLAEFFALTGEEQRLHLDHAADAVRDELAEMAREHKARVPDPRSALEYRSYKSGGMDCVVAVKHSDRTASIEISRDGGARPHAFVNPAKILLQPESSGPFVVFLIGKSLSRWVLEKQGVNLLGAIPELTGDWTNENRTTWKRLSAAASRINTKISIGGRRTYSSRSYAGHSGPAGW